MTQLAILERSFRPYVTPTRGNPLDRVHDAVYLLVRDRKVVYVGSTWNLTYRILSHKSEMNRLNRGAIEVGKRFDRVLFMPIPGRCRRLFEQALIRELRPKYNKRVDNPIRGEAAVLYWLGMRDTLTEDDIEMAVAS